MGLGATLSLEPWTAVPSVRCCLTSPGSGVTQVSVNLWLMSVSGPETAPWEGGSQGVSGEGSQDFLGL